MTMAASTARAFGYSATKTRNGKAEKLIVHRVAIFCECERDGQEYDRKWIEKAVAKARERAADNYYPPLHVRHHKPGESVAAAGYFDIVGTGEIRVKGEKKLAILADLIITNPSVIEAVQMEQAPYMSVEIFDLDRPPSIDGLALLDHNAPFLELPMLMVSDVQDENDKVTYGTTSFERCTEREPLVAFAKRGSSAWLLFEGSMEDEPKDDKPPGDTPPEAPPVPEIPKEEESGSGLDIGSLVQAILAKSLSVAEMEAIKGALQQVGGMPAAQAPMPQMPSPPQQVVQAPGASMEQGSNREADMASKEIAVQMAALTASNDVLAAKIRAMEEADAQAKDVKAAMQRFEGMAMGADWEETLKQRRAQFGAEGFRVYVDDYAARMPRHRTQARPEEISEKTYPEVVMEYAKQGPQALEMAANFADQHEALKSTGMKATLPEYIASQMARANSNGQAPAKVG